MKLLKLIPAAAIALTAFGSLDTLADSNSGRTSTYNLYCGGMPGNKFYHSQPKSAGRHYHSCTYGGLDNSNGTYCYNSSTNKGVGDGPCLKITD